MAPTEPNAKRRRASFEASRGTLAQPHPPANAPRRLLKAPKRSLQRAPVVQPEPDMTELVGYIYTHEEAFQSRDRLASLYSDFRSQQTTNPDGYFANLTAWRKALEHAAGAGVIPAPGATRNLLIIDTGPELAQALKHKDFGLPVCLRDVFADAIKKGAFVPTQDWNTSMRSIYQKPWFKLPNVSVGSVLAGAWELGKNQLFGPSNQPPLGSFVIVANVESAAGAILDEFGKQPHTSTTDRVFSKAAFWKRFARVPNPAAALTERDLDVLLKHMSRDRQVLAYDGHIIKFKTDLEQQLPIINQEDKYMAQLHDSIEEARARIVILQGRATKNLLAAKEATKLKQMSRAKACLRSKKLAESALEHHTNACAQLEELYLKAQQAADHVGIVAAMEAGANAMALLNKKMGGVEGVQNVMDSVRDELATADEINAIINGCAAPVDEGEIDDELAELEKAEKAQKEAEEAAKTKRLLDELPPVKKLRTEDHALLESPGPMDTDPVEEGRVPMAA